MHIDPSKYQLVKPEKGEVRSQREELINKFLTRLNGDRTKAGYTDLSYPRVAKMFKGMTEHQIYTLYEDIKHAEKFGGLLKWKLEQRKVVHK